MGVAEWAGTAGRIENCQIGVFVAYASRWGHPLIDRQLCLPKDWSDDATRRRTAAVPDDVEFKTKPAMAREMIERTLDVRLSGISSGVVPFACRLTPRSTRNRSSLPLIATLAH